MILEVNSCEVYSVCGCLCSSLTVPVTYTSSQSLLQTRDAQCLFCIHGHDACSQSSRTLIHWDLAPFCTDNQMGRQAIEWVFLRAQGEAEDFCVGLCVGMWQGTCSRIEYVCRGWLFPSVTNLPFFTTVNIRPLPTLPVFLGTLFSLFSVFSPQRPSSPTRALPGEQREQGKEYERSRAQCVCY